MLRFLFNVWILPLMGMGFFGVGQGPSSQEKQQFNALNSESDFAAGIGQSDLTASSNFMQGILSGDPSKIAQVLNPQISAVKQRTQQAKDQLAQFSPRSGGTAAAAANMDAGARSDITNLTGSLTGTAASGLGSEGGSLFSAGMSGHESAFNEADTMQQQTAAMFNDIFNSSGSTATAVAGMPGMPGKAASALKQVGTVF
jgi:hypothetical protein